MDRFLKRRNQGGEGDTKRRKIEWGSGSPCLIAAWNCNGLTARIRSGAVDEVLHFVTEHSPDAFFLSEVRIAAANDASGKAGPHTKWQRGQMKDNDKKSMEDLVGVRKMLAAKEMAGYKAYWSLANSKYAGTALLLRSATVGKPKYVRYNLSDDGDAAAHDDDGRVIFVAFDDFSVLHTYVPNNGWTPDHFARRKAWDEKVETFMARRKAAGERVMWLGDLNVAPADIDLSHPKHYRRQKKGKDVEQENVGQPGCTDAERNRFYAILDAGGLIDAYRKVHGEEKELTWRGTRGGLHEGRGMRIDHVIVSQELGPMINRVHVVGHGAERSGFMGSDHSPILVGIDRKREGDARHRKESDKGFPKEEGENGLAAEDSKAAGGK